MPETHAVRNCGRGEAPPYAGDLPPREAWEMLAERRSALLVDVRTLPEWQFTGLPDLSSLGKKPLCLSWKLYPTFDVNSGFLDRLAREAPDKDAPLLFMCRSGGRSLDAAIAAAGGGYSQAYNIAGGFEGEPDARGHRGAASGWKACDLPWEQQ